MQHFYVMPENIEPEKIYITDNEVHHILDVLRKTVGDRITLFDGMGNEYEAQIAEITGSGRKKVIVAGILKTSRSFTEPKTRIILFQSIPKSSKMDLIIQKCTEAGVFKFVPVISDRTIIKLEEKTKLEKTKRWRDIARNAAKQSGRGIVPEVGEITTFHSAIKACSENKIKSIILWESEKTLHLKEYLKINRMELSCTAVFIGPEGGFCHDEIAESERYGISSITLGSRILRTETTGLLTAAMILYEMNELG